MGTFLWKAMRGVFPGRQFMLHRDNTPFSDVLLTVKSVEPGEIVFTYPVDAIDLQADTFGSDIDPVNPDNMPFIQRIA